MTAIPNDSATAPARMAPPPTAQQQAAIDTKHVSVVLSAGAGCGKTSVLTQRFLSHLEPGRDAADLSSLVAITFTERAAREMRDRIRGQCLGRLRSCPAEQVDHWLKIVRELDSARISTIHSFCASLLRANAVEAGIDPAFGLLDETLGDSFLRQSVEIGLHELLAADDADVAELVFEFGLSRTRDLLASLVLQRYRIDFAKWEATTSKELAERWDRIWHSEYVPKLLRDLADSESAKRTMQLLRDNVPQHLVMRDRCEVLLDQIPRLAHGGDHVAVLAAIRENARVQGGGTKKDWDSEDIYVAVKDALTDLRAVVDKLQSQLEYDTEHLLRGAEIGLCALRAAAKVGVRYDARKADAGVLDFDDLLIGARDLLRDHQDVRRRIESGIKLLMVDEFQDTDPIQDQIVRYLCGKQELTGRLFVVGDSKQSIYRFRRAEPKVFHDLRARVAETGRLPLSMNFRSRPEILAFVNAMFDRALGDEYEALEAEPHQPAKTPCIEFLFAAAGADEGGEDDEIDQSAAARRRREADWIASRLTQILTDGVPRVHERGKQLGEFKFRTVELRDIVILFRAMSDVRYYEEALRAKGLVYYVVGGRAFFAQQEIFDVVNLCQYLDNVDDEVALIGVLRSPFFSLSDDAIVALGQSPTHALAHPPPPFLSEQQQAQVRLAGKVLAELREKKDHLPISRLLTLAIERTGYDASLLTEFLGQRKLANLRKLIDMARKFDQSGLFTLADFVDRLRDAVADETREALAATHPESANVIRLMSIHQSKGLEFPVVVVADMDRKGRDQLPAAHFDTDLGPLTGLPEKFGVKRDHPGLRMSRKSECEQDLAEARRVLYVAMTRAADLLILSANLKKAGQAVNPWLKLVAERFDLRSGQPRTEPTAEGVSILAKYAGKFPEIHVHQVKPAAVKLPPATTGFRINPPTLQDADTGSIPLTRLRETIDASEPVALPEMMKVIPPDRAARHRFSVSEIETIDEQIRAGSGATPAAHRRREKSVERDTDELISGDLSSAEQLGTLVHAVLERLDFRRPQEAEALLEKFSSFAASPVEPSARTAAATCVANLVTSPLGADLSSARQIHREIDFLLTFPPFVISGTIDCL
ncbi:MAG TPA: UvrD-helicase domain-containing protein, partial [Planctomycetaceae bacterium]